MTLNQLSYRKKNVELDAQTSSNPTLNFFSALLYARSKENWKACSFSIKAE